MVIKVKAREVADTIERIVVIFDMCSSTRMIEDLTLSGNLKAMKNVLLATKDDLDNWNTTMGEAPLLVDIYKFLGDGWVILLDPEIDGEYFYEFLKYINHCYDVNVNQHLRPVLQTIPPVMGLSFGIDFGPLIRTRYDGRYRVYWKALECRFKVSRCN